MTDRTFQTIIAAMCSGMVLTVAGAWTLQAAQATVNAWQEAEAIEWCHRQAGGSPEVCGPLPGDGH
jgi:hypothetical protein